MLRTLIQFSGLSATLALAIIPHHHCIDKYRDFRAKYHMDQTEEPVKEKCQKRFEQVMDDMKLSDDHRSRLELFYVYGYDIFSAGFFSTIFGKGIVGIPQSYEYESTKDIDKHMLFIQDKPLDWTKKEAHDFLESIVLSEYAQKYAIAREIMKIETRSMRYDIMLQGGLGTFTIFMYETCLYFIKALQGRTLYRFLLALFTYGGAIFTWTAVRIENNCNRDIKFYENLLSLSPKYIEGAHEFYSKLYQRNQALKLILKDNNKSSTSYIHEYLFAWNRGLSIPQKLALFNPRFQEI
ncbi:transmembrane protein 177 [Augochlora pura]